MSEPIVDILRECGPMTVREVSEKLNTSPERVRRKMWVLVKYNLVQTCGFCKNPKSGHTCRLWSAVEEDEKK